MSLITSPSLSHPRHPRPAPWSPDRILLSAVCALTFLTAGCRSLDGPASASFASVTIRGQTEEAIAAATTAVFEADGYSGVPAGSGRMVFEKEASRARTLSRAGLIATQAGERTVNRVRVEIIPLDDGAHRLQCQAYVVNRSGDSFFEEEIPLSHLRGGAYQSLLRQVDANLKP